MARFIRGENILPQIEQARRLGVNLVRVFGRVRSPGWDGWDDYTRPESAPGYVDRAYAFFTLLASHGLRCELVPLTYQDDVGIQRQQVQQAFDFAFAQPNVIVEVSNEPDVNRIDAVSALSYVDRHGLPCALGYYEPHDGVLDYGDFITMHADRGRFPRSDKDVIEFRDGGVSVPPMAPSRRYVVSDEPQKAAAPGSPALQYASNPYDFQTSCGIARMYGGGWTLHTENGRYGRLLDAVEVACGEAVRAVYQFLPPLFGRSYTRGGLSDFPLVWSDADSELGHIYGAFTPDRQTAYVVLIRPVGHGHGGPVPGWRIDAQVGPVMRLVRG